MQLDRAEAPRWAGVSEETRPKYQASRAREQKVSPQPTKNTYNRFNKARESKMPGGSSVTSLNPIVLKATRNQVDQIVRVGSISRPIAHQHHH